MKKDISCKRCFDAQLTRAGFIGGKQRYKCKACGYFFTNTPLRGRSNREKFLSIFLYSCGLSLRKIASLFDVSQVAVLKWLHGLVPTLREKLKEKNEESIILGAEDVKAYLSQAVEDDVSGKLFIAVPVSTLTENVGIVVGEGKRCPIVSDNIGQPKKRGRPASRERADKVAVSLS